MSFLEKLEKKLGNFAVPHLTEILIFGQVAVFVASNAGWLEIGNVLLIPERVLMGEWRRLATFLFIPPDVHPVFLIFAWLFYYFMGTALESHWGEFRYNLFIFIGVSATIAVSFLNPFLPAGNAFIGGSIFLAFAFLYPDFVIYIFFILPVRIKWVAIITWATYILGLIFGSWQTRLEILASVSNLLLFFGKDLLGLAKFGGKKMVRQTQEIVEISAPFHKCAVCGITDKTNPEMEFRYCSRCRTQQGFCKDHILNHTHDL